MTSIGCSDSIDSMDKSVLSSETDIYDQNQQSFNEYVNNQTGNGYHLHHHGINNYSEYPNPNKVKTSPMTAIKTATVGSARIGAKSRPYGLPEYKPPPQPLQNNKNNGNGSSSNGGFELSYRNEGFRDNSTFSGTRNNSVSTNLTEDTPITHQTDTDEISSDYYGNASTLPLRPNNETMSFLTALKQKLPDYGPLPSHSQGHSSFLPPAPDPPDLSSDHSNSSTLPYDKKIDRFNFTPVSDDDLSKIEIRRPELNQRNSNTNRGVINQRNEQQQSPQLIDIRRPDSYYTAVRSSRAPQQISALQKLPDPPTPPSTLKEGMMVSLSSSKRPKTVYEAADATTVIRPTKTMAIEDSSRPFYTRSKSEALLETNFDEKMPIPLQMDSRSYSQPLETAM